MEKTPTSHPAFPGPQPVPVARRFLLCPEGASPHDGSPFGEERIPIILGRGKAFGSGFHETTASCLEALENLALTEKSAVLDVGTGTGILSMAALLLGARYAVAVDMDKEAAVTCRRNMELNGLEKYPRRYNPSGSPAFGRTHEVRRTPCPFRAGLFG
jgi:ribosomal protein L11 methyltransferase